MSEWQDVMNNPPVTIGQMKCFIVAVKRKSGKVYTFPAMYLNYYPLEYEEACPHCAEIPERDCPANGSDGCPTTGWFTDAPDDDYERLYTRLRIDDGEEFKGWQSLPVWDEGAALEQVKSAPSKLRSNHDRQDSRIRGEGDL